MFRLKTILIFLFAVSICLGSMPDSSATENMKLFRVDSITISGNSVTKDKIILRELTFKIGDFINNKDILFNRERIYSLGLFNEVNIVHKTENNISLISIVVDESWYLWPIPIVDLKDSQIKKLTAGMNLLYKNFRGMNETISTVFAFGYDPFVYLSYYNPWLIRDNNISLSAGVSYNRIHNISRIAEWMYGEQFEYKYLAGYINLGKRFNIYNEAYFLLGFDYIEIPKKVDGVVTGSQNKIDRTPKAGINYIFDNRNLKQFADSGFYGNVNYVYSGFGLDGIDFSILNLELRYYNKLIFDDLTCRLKTNLRFTSGKSIPFYKNSFLGVDQRVRGHYSDVREGNHSYLFSVDFKYPIIKEWYFSIKLPLLPRELTSYRIGIYGNLFGDAGATQYRDSKLTLDNFYSGYGGGLIFAFLPYNVFRLEYAFNEFGKGELIFEIGFTF
jgi:outer membrane protein assembly factor BamA